MKKYRNYTTEQLIDAVRSSYSIAEVCKKIGLVPIGGNYHTIKLYITRFNLCTDHFTGKAWNKYSITDIKYVKTNKSLKRGLIQKYGHKCQSCNLSTWLSKDIPLELEHINGNNLDSSESNLKLLCPNCHSQTPTYRRKKSSL